MSSKTNHPYNVLYIYPLFVYVTTETPWSGWEEISLRWGYLPREHSLVCSSKTIWMFTLTSVIDAPQVYIIYCNWVCKTTSTRTAHDFISHNALQLNKTIVLLQNHHHQKEWKVWLLLIHTDILKFQNKFIHISWSILHDLIPACTVSDLNQKLSPMFSILTTHCGWVILWCIVGYLYRVNPTMPSRKEPISQSLVI